MAMDDCGQLLPKILKTDRWRAQRLAWVKTAVEASTSLCPLAAGCRFVLTRQHVLEALVENIEKALGRWLVKIGAEGREVYVYRGDVANRAIQLAGIELQMFTERKEIKCLTEFDEMSDVELVQLLEQEARALLEDHSGGGDNDGIGDRGA